jgi:hypothetical protein
MRRFGSLAIGFPVVLGLLAAAFAQKTDSRPSALTTAEQEAQAIAFIKQHHGELVDLVTKLKKTNQKQYEKAIGDLAKTSKTLAETEQRDPRRYELDLRAWQTQSRIQVLAARMSMEKSPEIEAELKAALREQVAVRLQQHELERERLTARLEKLDTAITRLKETSDEEADRAFDRIAKGLPAGGKQTKPTSSQAVKPETRNKEAKAQ